MTCSKTWSLRLSFINFFAYLKLKKIATINVAIVFKRQSSVTVKYTSPNV